ncbi:odorant receptor 46a-like isoform X2 [Anoplolepis gracilipes]|uniref:odorant receptor 46a-like isoform X2 n=1 Tax=Anoplolepis gracilipes TaxID=354296 RepID=UPI003BA20B29
MRILEVTFKVLTICGCWQPESWTSVYKHDFCDNFCVLLPMMIACFKLFSLLGSHKNITKLTDILINKPCKPVEPNEIKINYKFDKSMQNNTLHYAAMCMVTCAIIVVTSFLTNFSEKKLTYRAWVPFEYSSMISFCLLYVHQLVGLATGALINVACDSLICGLLAHVCCQYEILTYRLNRMLDSDSLRNCVQQHCKIFRLAFLVNTNFRMIISVQFLMSMFVVCFNLYVISLSKLDARCIRLALFMGCMLTQIFVYCWYGNQVRLKSRQFVDNIFEIKWLTLNKNLKKSLIIMMERTVMPIEITSAYTFSVNLDSFMTILKTSYSTYNLLQQMKE